MYKLFEKNLFSCSLKSGKQIPAARLKALPYVEYTVEVQEEIEKQQV